jgi:hypothetical protein
MSQNELDPRVGAALGGLSAIVLAAALVPFREELAGEALALVLVLPVLLGAVTGGRLGGAVAAVCATVGFDFFLTQPYLSMTISSADDVETAVLLLIVALVVGTVAAGGQRAATRAEAGQAELESIHRVAEVVASDAPRAEIIHTARRELIAVLSLEACEFDEQVPATGLPTLEHTGTFLGVQFKYVHGGFVLPAGVQLAVASGGRVRGRFVLHGDGKTPVPLDARRAAVVIADHVGAALAAENGSRREERA